MNKTTGITMTCEAVIGINPGYFHNNENTCNDSSFNAYFQGMLEEYCKENNTDLSFVITPSKVIYPYKYGCPLNGEEVYIITSTANPSFVSGQDQLEAWKHKCGDFITQLAKGLEQSTVMVTFSGACVHYYCFD